MTRAMIEFFLVQSGVSRRFVLHPFGPYPSHQHTASYGASKKTHVYARVVSAAAPSSVFSASTHDNFGELCHEHLSVWASLWAQVQVPFHAAPVITRILWLHMSVARRGSS